MSGKNKNDDNVISFSEVAVSPFIRKVYAIIMAQLAVTAAVVAWFLNDARLLSAVEQNAGVFCGVLLGTYLTTPLLCNYVFLLLFTLSLSAHVGVDCSFYDGREVLMAGGITFAIVLALTVFALQTRIDFTVMNGSILFVCLVLMLFGLAAALSPFPALRVLCCALGAVLVMCVMLVRDTQQIVGARHRYDFSPEAYAFAASALLLYAYIICIFMSVLSSERASISLD